MKSLDTKDVKESNGTSKHSVENTIDNFSGKQEDNSHTIWDTNGTTAV